MMRMMGELLGHLRNDFACQEEAVRGELRIEGGRLPLPFPAGDFVRIVGSRRNDGVYLVPLADLTDETFTGAAVPLAVPPAVVQLCEEIEGYCERHGEDGFLEERLGDSVVRRAAAPGGAPAGWQAVFRARLNQWRKA